MSVLIWEEAMDMTDWARLLLAGSVGTEVRAGDNRTMTTEEQSVSLPTLGYKRLHSPCPEKGLD